MFVVDPLSIISYYVPANNFHNGIHFTEDKFQISRFLIYGR